MDNDKPQLIYSLVEKFNKVVAKTAEYKKKPKYYGTQILFYSSEMQLLELIGENPGLSVTGLAEILDVTKGAVSQTLKKLEKKKCIKKIPDKDNQSRLLVSLSEFGRKAFEDHLKWHEKVDKGFRKTLHGINEDNVNFMLNFLSKYDDFLEITNK